MKQKCSRCKQVLDASNFTKCKTSHSGLDAYCRKCKHQIRKEKNPKVKTTGTKVCKGCNVEKQIEFFNLNKESKDGRHRLCKSCRKVQREKKKEHKKYYDRLYRRYRKQNDINYRILSNLRNRVYCALVRGYKAKTTLELLGCTIEQLRVHLESQFTEGMTWDNYGKWHIDHIKPCASFDLTNKKEQLECFHYTNLQPLWARDNILKGSKLKE